jgi:xanthine dehydrogenase small subunit
VVSLAGFCLADAAPTKENAVAAVDGNICRCTGYKSIERAAGLVAEQLQARKSGDAISFAMEKKMLPEYFSGIKEKLQSLRNNRLPTPDSQLPTLSVGGGTDLYVQQHHEMKDAAIRFLFDHPELNGIRKEGNVCIIGPSATVSDLLNSSVINEAFPSFPVYAKLVSSTPIRNMATIAGNFVNASPIGDLTIFFLALDAQLTLTPSPSPQGGEGGNTISKREIPLRQFYKGYKQLNKKPEEVISMISFELPGKDDYFNFEKVSNRTHLDIATVNSAISIKMNGDIIAEAGLSAGGVGPVPIYLQKTSAYLKGRKINDETISGAIEVMKTEISPISDVRGSKEYKTLLLGQLMKAHLIPLSAKKV